MEGLDRLLGGGWAAGRTNIIYGPPSSLKTMIAVATGRLFSSRGGVTYFIDTESKMPEYMRLRGLILYDAPDINKLLNTLVRVKANTKFIHPALTLVVIDSLTAPLHHLQLQYPDYAAQKTSALNHLVRQLSAMGVTVLATSWRLSEGYSGRNLNPAIVLRTEKTGTALKAVLEKSDVTIVGSEELSVEEVLRAATREYHPHQY